jgi:OmpA-OmpF porin, OOP family
MFRKPITILLLSFSTFISAQDFHPWEVGINAGVSAYQGDLDAFLINPGIRKSGPLGGLHLRYEAHNMLALRLNALGGKLVGDESQFLTPEYHRLRRFSFTSPLFAGFLKMEVYPLGQYKKNNSPKSTAHLSFKNRRKVALYGVVGVGAVYTNPVVDWNEEDGPNPAGPAAGIQADKLAKVNAINIAIPLGGGMRIALSERITLGLEAAIQPTFSDYLDGVSAAGNPNKDDWFFSGAVSFGYSFGTKKLNPPKSQAGIDPQLDAEPVLPAGTTDKGGSIIVTDGNALDKVDSDGDGVMDDKDQCPEEAGKMTLAGCPDGDNDGISDKYDGCPTIPGVVAFRGCPAVDRDKDGVADGEDKCPDMPGQAEWGGCPDSDGDGISDNRDNCPGIAGLDFLSGCPDTDQDGIADKDDNCPTIAGVRSKNGCPENSTPFLGVPYKAVYFNSAVENWYATSMVTLNEVVQYLNADPSLKARIEGHTDNTGEEPANDLLSETRAKKCYDFLIKTGLNPQRLTYVGHGPTKPIASNETKEGRQLNRRVEIHFYK